MRSSVDLKTCTNVRNPIRCRRCDARLLAECLSDTDDLQRSGVFGFVCPVCMNWNNGVPLRGFALITVVKDPRAVPRE
jgi:hypothetical protein